MSSICKADCSACSFGATCPGCEATCGKPFGGDCVAAEFIQKNGCEAYAQFKGNLVTQINAVLKPLGAGPIDRLFELSGAFVNLPYPLPNGKTVSFLDDTKIYLGAQIEGAEDGKCFGVVTDGSFVLVSKYKENGAEPELVLFRK